MKQREQADPGGAELAGDADAVALEVGHLLDRRVGRHDQRDGVLGEDLGDVDHIRVLGARLQHLVAAGEDQVLLARDQRAELVFAGAVVLERDVQPGGLIVAERLRDVERRELDVGDVGQADGQGRCRSRRCRRSPPAAR